MNLMINLQSASPINPAVVVRGNKWESDKYKNLDISRTKGAILIRQKAFFIIFLKAFFSEIYKNNGHKL